MKLAMRPKKIPIGAAVTKLSPLPVRVTRRVKPGELFATFHDARVFLNRVTSHHRDRYVKSPEYKVTAVRIVKLDDPPRELPTTEAKEVS